MRKIIGNALRARRLLKGYSQKQVAAMMGCEKQYISNLENGLLNCTCDKVEEYLTAIGDSPEDLFKGLQQQTDTEPHKS